MVDWRPVRRLGSVVVPFPEVAPLSTIVEATVPLKTPLHSSSLSWSIILLGLALLDFLLPAHGNFVPSGGRDAWGDVDVCAEPDAGGIVGGDFCDTFKMLFDLAWWRG